MSGLRFHVALPPPFSFAHTVSAARFYSVLGVLRPDGAYRRVLRVGETLALAEFAPAGEGVDVRLLVASGPLDAQQFAARARWMLHPALDLAPFYALQEADPALSRLIAPLAGLRAFRLDSAFESLAITIIEQQIALTMAQAAERWLIRTYGESLTYEGEAYYAFPRPETLAQLSVADLTPLKITFIRIGRLLEIARAVADNTLDLEPLAAEPDALYQRMLALNGVGHWTASWALIRASGQFRYFGQADVALRAAANQHFAGLPGRMDGGVLDAHFARFGAQAGLAAFYLIIRYAHDKVKL
ncbi:MAG: DNA-3-methyladenine glycosylase 2 family protein [Anaerolineae bacterium]|nr:DNA-3-methyladenine glycosylase 2 family protein [Anaerolineae bacterium]